MDWTIKLEARSGWGEVETIEVGRFKRRVVGLTADEIGLSLAEGKEFLAEFQPLMLQTQMEEYAVCKRVCPECLKLRRKRLPDADHPDAVRHGSGGCAADQHLDAPEVAVVAALTHIRLRPWLEQMVARATRVDPQAGPYGSQCALVFHPDDPLFAQLRRRLEFEQGTMARAPKAAHQQATLPGWLLDQLPVDKEGITPLESNALGLRYDTLQPGPDLAMRRPEQEAAQSDMLEPPSAVERRLRARLGEMVAAQAVEDEAGRAGLGSSGIAGPGLYHLYNAVLKRVTGNKSRAEMTLAELEAVLGWLERNRLSEQLHLLEGDPRHAWTVRKRGEWTPPVGRVPSKRRVG